MRKWLRENKIVFETVASTSLTVAAIIVSIVQTNIAFRQTDITERQNQLINKQNSLVDLQARIAEAQALPTFEIRIAQQMNPATLRADDNFLIIDNTGGPVHEFSSKTIFSLEIDAAPSATPIRNIKLFIPINDYFSASAITAAGKGQLITNIGRRNNEIVTAFEKALRERAHSQNWEYANTEERTYTQIVYRDILDRVHEEYYFVEPIYGATRVSNEEGRVKFAAWSAGRSRQMSDLLSDKIFDELTALEKAYRSR